MEMNKAILFELKEKADAGDKEAEYQYGICLMNGVCTKQNLSKAFFYLLRSADHTNKNASHLLRTSFKTRNVYDWYKVLAEAGHSRAQYELGKYYDDTLHNPDDAFSLYLSSANQNEADAIYKVAVAYRRGNGVAKNTLEANRYLEKYIKLDEAKVELLAKTKPEFVDWLKELETSGSIEAKYQLARIDSIINNTKVTKEPCWSRYLVAADAGHARAAYLVAKEYKDQEQGDIEKYFHYLKISVNGGDPDGELEFARYLQNKKNRTNKEAKDSFYYFKQLADDGNNEAILHVARAYAEGIGVRQSDEKARKYLKDNILNESGDGEFAYFMGQLYGGYGANKEHYGTYLERFKGNRQDRMKLYQISAQKGNPTACLCLGAAYDENRIIHYSPLVTVFYCALPWNYYKTDYVKARSFYEKVLRYDDNDCGDTGKARSLIAGHFEYGLGVDIDLEKAFHLYCKAAEQRDYLSSQELTYRSVSNMPLASLSSFSWVGIPQEIKSIEDWYWTLMHRMGATDSKWPNVEPMEKDKMSSYYPSVLARIAHEYIMTDYKSPYAYRRLSFAFQWFVEAANHGDEFSIKSLGKAYQTKKISDWYKHLAENKNINGSLAYADLLGEEGVSFLESPCRELYLNAAQHGHLYGMYMAYLIYKDSDKEKSLYYLKIAAEGKHPRAQYIYGYYLWCKKNRTQEESCLAFQLFSEVLNSQTENHKASIPARFKLTALYFAGVTHKSSNVNLSDVRFRLIDCYEYGIGIERSLIEAKNLCASVPYKNDKGCMNFPEFRHFDLLLNLYYEGHKEYLEDLLWYKYRMEEYNAVDDYESNRKWQAQFRLGIYYGGWNRIYSGEEIINDKYLTFSYTITRGKMEEVDLEKSYEWFMLAAQKHPEARSILGSAFESQNIKDWYEKEAEEGDPVCQFELAEVLFMDGTAESVDRAIRLYDAAYKQDHMEAAYKLACYYREKGDEREEIYAESLKKAAEEKSLWGMCKYARYVFDIDLNLACSLLQEAADHGSLEAMLMLGQVFFEGNDVIKKDLQKAFTYLNKGADASKDVSDYPYEINPKGMDFGEWLCELLNYGDQNVWETYIYQSDIQTGDLTLEATRRLLDQYKLLFDKTKTDDEHKIDQGNIIWAFHNLFAVTNDLDCIFTYIQEFYDFISEQDDARQDLLIRKFYNYYCIAEFLQTYKKSKNRYMDLKTGKTVYRVPDLFNFTPVSDYEEGKDFWYDCALAFDLAGKYEDAMFIYEYAALLGSNKAWYSLVNMGQEESLYFLEMIENY